ncbi:sm-like protein LSM1A isoform X2 [Gossypium hirsutum]|uniref:U6 snRNA-associated Sm-like protein LSm1 n=1 Tax=Gossypium hirsutum TaxID=3635 RepID=A0ABM3BW18_GOSHI|nr:sm-like protein LSM1A isoform X2 [Gossypium hirsutum]
MSWAGPDDIFLSTSLATYLDKKLLVLLRDGRKLLGLLRSFDQFANVVLEGACERVIVGDLYCDIPLGLYVIRGENVVIIGELVCRFMPSSLTLFSLVVMWNCCPTMLFFFIINCYLLHRTWKRRSFPHV